MIYSPSGLEVIHKGIEDVFPPEKNILVVHLDSILDITGEETTW